MTNPARKREREERHLEEMRIEEERRRDQPTRQEQLLDRVVALLLKDLSPEVEELAYIVRELVEQL